MRRLAFLVVALACLGWHSAFAFRHGQFAGGGTLPVTLTCATPSFTGGASGGTVVCPLTVTLSPSTSFTGSITLTGKQQPSGNDAATFAVSGCPSACELSIASSPPTDQPGQYQITATVTQAGYPTLQQPMTIQATGSGAAGWIEVDGGQDFGIACPNSMINCRQMQTPTSITYSTARGGVGQVVVPTPISPLPVANHTSVSIAGLTAGTCSGGTGLNGQAFFSITDVTDAQHFSIYMPGMCGTAGQTFGVGSATLGSGFWNSALDGNYNNEGGHSGYNAADCTISGGNLNANAVDANWTDPNGTTWTYHDCSIYSYQQDLTGAQNALTLAQTQEMYIDAYYKTAGGAGGAKGMHQTITSFAVIPWNNGPEIDTCEQYGNVDTPSGCNTGAIAGGSGFTTCAFGSGDLGAQFQQVGSDLTLSLASYYFNGSFGCSDSSNLPVQTNWYVNWDNDIDDGNSGPVDGSTGFGIPAEIQYFRLYNKVPNHACYATIPSHTTIPHVGTC